MTLQNVRDAVHKGTTLSDDQVLLVCNLANELLPIWQRCRGAANPEGNVHEVPLHLVAPLRRAIGALVIAAGKPKLAPTTTPSSSAGALHAFVLSAPVSKPLSFEAILQFPPTGLCFSSQKTHTDPGRRHSAQQRPNWHHHQTQRLPTTRP